MDPEKDEKPAEDLQTEDTSSSSSSDGDEKARTPIEDDRRQALEKALKDVSEASASSSDEEPRKPHPKTRKGAREKQDPAVSTGEQEEPPLEPPSEYDLDEKAAFRAMPREGQRAALRLHQTYLRQHGEFQRDYGTTRQLVETMKPFLDAIGETDLTPQEAIQKSLRLWSDAQKDPEGFLRDFAAAKKLNVKFDERSATPPEGGEKKVVDEGGQRALELVNGFLEEQERSKTQQKFGSAFERLSSSRNADGSARYPDLSDDSPAGLEKAQQIGRLFASSEFRNALKVIAPNVTTEEQVLLWAYLQCGGRRVDAESSRSLSRHEHIARSRRASASQPGRAAQTGQKPPVRLSRREANERALAELNSD